MMKNDRSFVRRAALPLLLSGTLMLGACSTFWGESETTPPLPGERISVLDLERELRPAEEADLPPLTLPEQEANTQWTQTGSNAANAAGHLAFAAHEPKRVWNSSIGDGTRRRLPLTAQPVVLGESIFALDTAAQLSAFATQDGKRRWRVSLRPEQQREPAISGGIAAQGTTIYATAGYAEVVAVDAANGEIKWRAALPSPSRAAPSVIGQHLFVTTLNNALLALDAQSGEVLWEFAGMSQTTGLVGAASPAATTEFVIPAFSSGEIYSLRILNGSVTWSDNLSNTLRLGGMMALSDIRALPVVKDNVVYAISAGGRMAAIDLITGARLWQREISGSKTPVIAGNRVFIITSDAQIAALNRADGEVVWVSQLARWRNPEKRENAIVWTDPILAGGRLMTFSTDGRAAEINPQNGALIREWRTGRDIRVAPVVANNTLYLLSEDGTLSAYR